MSVAAALVSVSHHSAQLGDRLDCFCKSGRAYNGITDVLTKLLMKVQCDAENRDHNSCVSLRPWSGLGISYSLGKRDGICGMV